MNGDTVAVLTIPQVRQINKVYNANDWLLTNNMALKKHVVVLDSLIDQKDTLLNLSAKNTNRLLIVSDSLFYASVQVGEQLQKSKIRTKQAFWYGALVGGGVMILTIILGR